MKQLIKKLLREYYEDFDLGFDEPQTNDFDLEFDEPQTFDFDSLPNVVTLYRILELDSVDDIKIINKDEPGSHYSMDREHLIKTRAPKKDKVYVLMTVKAPKKLIDVKETMRTNMEFPMEKEITLKNKGKGAKIINIELLKY